MQQLTDALLELEEERAVWSSKEKASVDSIAEKVKMSNTEIALLSKDLSEVLCKFVFDLFNVICLKLYGEIISKSF